MNSTLLLSTCMSNNYCGLKLTQVTAWSRPCMVARELNYKTTWSSNTWVQEDDCNWGGGGGGARGPGGGGGGNPFMCYM